jgi:hypothetical protein
MLDRPHVSFGTLEVRPRWKAREMEWVTVERLQLIASPAALERAGVSVEDLENPDSRAGAIRADHPEFALTLLQGTDQIELDGQRVSIRLHLAMHGMLANQLAADEPLEVFDTAKRLLAAGYHRHIVLHMLGSTLIQQIPATQPGEDRYDRERHVAGLEALPHTWEQRRAWQAVLAGSVQGPSSP